MFLVSTRFPPAAAERTTIDGVARPDWLRKKEPTCETVKKEARRIANSVVMKGPASVGPAISGLPSNVAQRRKKGLKLADPRLVGDLDRFADQAC